MKLLRHAGSAFGDLFAVASDGLRPSTHFAKMAHLPFDSPRCTFDVGDGRLRFDVGSPFAYRQGPSEAVCSAHADVGPWVVCVPDDDHVGAVSLQTVEGVRHGLAGEDEHTDLRLPVPSRF